MRRFLILFFISFCYIGISNAQTIRDYVRRGNRLMQDTVGGNDFSEKAIIQYKRALEIDSTYSTARYNLGNALLRQGNPEGAMKEFLAASKYEKDKQNLSDIYHNMGVLLQASKKYAEAVEFYRESLRNDPSNHQTRYNYVLAKWQLKNQQNNQDDSGEDQQDQQKQDNQKDKQQQDQHQQENQKQEKKQENAKPEPQPEMSKENAERLLNAAMRNEKETQEKIQRQQQEAPRKRLQKQW